VIVPRWEWRTFGERFGDAEDRFAALAPEHVHESDEVYLLSSAADETVKVRDGLLDVKHLERVNHDGLEQWKPVLKEGFPLSGETVGVALTALGVPPPPPPSVSTVEPSVSTVEDLIAAGKDLVAVPVRKRRVHYTLSGCMAELTDVRTETAATRTIAVEAEDPARVIAAVRELGLGERPNVSFPRGLKTLLGLDAHRYAVLDVGTNSVKFHVGERRADGSWSTVADHAEVTRLGEGLDESGSIQPEPMERTIAAIADMAEESRHDGAEKVAAVGTAGLRIAKNSAEFVAAVQERCGVAIEVISGEEEGRLAYLAATSGLKLGHGPLAEFDTGGGSSQFTFGRGKDVDEQFSVNVGAARFTERFGLDGAVSEENLAEAFEAIGSDLARLDGRPVPDALVGMGGAVTNLAAVKHELATYDSEVVQGTVLDLGEIDRQIELYRTSNAEERRRIVGLQPGRADVILAGACIVRTVIAKLGRDSATVSDRGLRHGLLVERFG
jgi:exopolyphosphatase / guanosine-5'-triphosphate,3'-diphosphate pyrophosphatase